MDRLRTVRKQAESQDEARVLFRRYIAIAREHFAWTDADVAEYSQAIKVLMGKDDAAALDLYPEGVFATAAEARKGAVDFWRAAA